jgi:hypothetical protein
MGSRWPASVGSPKDFIIQWEAEKGVPRYIKEQKGSPELVYPRSPLIQEQKSTAKERKRIHPDAQKLSHLLRWF